MIYRLDIDTDLTAPHHSNLENIAFDKIKTKITAEDIFVENT